MREHLRRGDIAYVLNGRRNNYATVEVSRVGVDGTVEVFNPESRLSSAQVFDIETGDAIGADFKGEKPRLVTDDDPAEQPRLIEIRRRRTHRAMHDRARVLMAKFAENPDYVNYQRLVNLIEQWGEHSVGKVHTLQGETLSEAISRNQG